MNYRRARVPGGSYFFTVVTEGRRPLLATPEAVGLLREAIRQVRRQRPFEIEAIVVLPDHLHTIWTLPPDDSDFSTRWRLIKTWFTKHQAQPGKRVWQHRYWEHVLRDEEDLRRHLDYIHFNPVKHGLAASVRDWPYSSFHSFVAQGWYQPSWGEAYREPKECAAYE